VMDEGTPPPTTPTSVIRGLHMQLWSLQEHLSLLQDVMWQFRSSDEVDDRGRRSPSSARSTEAGDDLDDADDNSDVSSEGGTSCKHRWDLDSLFESTEVGGADSEPAAFEDTSSLGALATAPALAAWSGRHLSGV